MNVDILDNYQYIDISTVFVQHGIGPYMSAIKLTKNHRFIISILGVTIQFNHVQIS